MFLAKEKGYLEIIIYVVAMVVGLAANAYRNYVKRKEKEAQASNPETVNKPDFPEVLFEPVDKFPEEEEPVYEESLIEAEEPVREEELPLDIVPQQMEAAEVVSEGQAALEITMEQLDLEADDAVDPGYNQIADESKSIYNLDEGQEEGTSESQTGFDLEKAVIYSEILNPKYINNGY